MIFRPKPSVQTFEIGLFSLAAIQQNTAVNLLNKSLTDEQNPIVFIDAATALANANTIPTEAPNSGPNDREII